MQFKAISRPVAEKSNWEEKKHIIISIRCPFGPESSKPHPATNRETQAVLFLQCDDLDYAPMPGSATWGMLGGKFQLFSRFDAEAILSVIRATSPEVVIVHCQAGQSRSAGVASALSKFYNDDDKRFFHMPYTPNMHVYRTMLNYLQETHDEAVQSREDSH
tara:strand:- start:3420 stop:3902 length:483 start_codon:yes stop_codon:yes gene_type:complete